MNLAIPVLAAIGALVACCWLSGCSGRESSQIEEASRVVRAADSFVKARVDSGAARPASVQMSELVAAGLITQGTANALKGAVVDVLPPADEGDPGQIVIRLRLPGGKMVGLHGDGSIQELIP